MVLGVLLGDTTRDGDWHYTTTSEGWGQIGEGIKGIHTPLSSIDIQTHDHSTSSSRAVSHSGNDA